MMLDYIDRPRTRRCGRIHLESAKRFYETDKNCDTKIEPAGTDFLSPCLTEAALMSRVMDRPAFLTWLDGFLPAMHSAGVQTASPNRSTPAASRGRTGSPASRT